MAFFRVSLKTRYIISLAGYCNITRTDRQSYLLKSICTSKTWSIALEFMLAIVALLYNFSIINLYVKTILTQYSCLTLNPPQSSLNPPSDNIPVCIAMRSS